MKAAIVYSAGADPVYADFADPVAQEGQQLVTVKAAAISRLARSRASGSHYSSHGSFPFIAGIDGAGTLADGRRVYFLTLSAPFGSMAERSLVSDGHSVAIPEQLDDVVAAAIANPGMSSWAALNFRAGFKPGDSVLINGATGTSGRLAVQIARHLGAGRIVATGRNTEALEALRSLGAHETITIEGDEDALEQAFNPHMKAGVNVVLDYLWGPSARALLIAAARTAEDTRPMRYVQIGAVSSPELSLPAAVLRASAIELMGSGLGSIGMDKLLEAISGVFRAAAAKEISVPARTVPLSHVADIWNAAEGNERVVLTV